MQDNEYAGENQATILYLWVVFHAGMYVCVCVKVGPQYCAFLPCIFTFEDQLLPWLVPKILSTTRSRNCKEENCNQISKEKILKETD